MLIYLLVLLTFMYYCTQIRNYEESVITFEE